MSRVVLALAVASAVLAAHPAAAMTYAIGGGAPAGARAFATLQEFGNAVDCLNGGDQVLLAGDAPHVGTLSLAPCDPSATGTVTIQGPSADRPARLDAALTAKALGLRWAPAAADEIRSPQGGGIQIFALGPLGGAVEQVFWPNMPAGPAAAPDQGIQRQPKTFLLSRVQTRREGCGDWLCIASDDPAWKAQLRSMAASPDKYWPMLVLRNSPWSFTRHRVTAVDATRGDLRIAAAEGTTGVAEDRDFVEPGFGVMFVHGASALDRPGEWFYAPGARKLFLAVAEGTKAEALAAEVGLALDRGNRGSTPALTFEAQRRGKAAGLTLVVRHLEISGSAGPGLFVRGLGAVDIRKIAVHDVAEHGVVADGVDRVSIVDNDIARTGNNGVLVTDVSTLEIRGNRISRAGRIGIQPQLTMQFNGIRAAGFGRADIRENEISDVGYAGIMLAERGSFAAGSGKAQLVIAGNRISRFCQMLNDCGAIYINGGGKGRDKPAPVDASIEKRIVNNSVSDPEPNLQGLPAGEAAGSAPRNKTGAWVRMVGAVYLDHGASGYDIRGNTVDGLYTPYGWSVFNGGIENACNREVVTQCKSGPKAYRCYTDQLGQCNQAPARPTK